MQRAVFPDSLPDELAALAGAPAHRDAALAAIPEPWRGRLTARRFRRWVHATRAAAKYNATMPADAPVLNFFPMRPQPLAPISEVIRELRMRVGYTPTAQEPTFAWDGETWFSPRSARRLPANAINRECLDLSKSRVHESWQRVSGRSVAVDPTSTTGPIIEKPEENGRHGARVVNGPVSGRRRGFVYERLIDTRDGGYITQTRPVLVGFTIVLAYEKWRRHEDMFFGTLLSLVREPGELYSDEEQRQLIALARDMHLDYGEFDVVRDRTSGQIEVVDVNRTPSRPHGLPARSDDTDRLWKRQAEAVRDLLLRPRGF